MIPSTSPWIPRGIPRARDVLRTLVEESRARRAASAAFLIGLLAATGCESAVEPDAAAADGNVVIDDGRTWPDDPYVVNSAAVDGQELTIEVSYAGGCAEHVFTLVLSTTFRETNPVQLPAVLAHDAGGDACEAWLTASLIFDLAVVETRYRQFYGQGSGPVVLRIEVISGEDVVFELAG